MPKISLHVEADSIEEYLEIVASLTPGERFQQHRDNWASEPKDEAPVAEKAPLEALADAIEDARKETLSTAADHIKDQIDAPPAEAAPEKPARKPRGPNKPKMAPVTEEAPEEVEHVGTVAVAEEQGNGKDEVLTRMDLGDTIAGYVRKYGINFAQTDVSKMLQDMFGPDVRKKSDVPEDQKSLRQAISTITQATVDNPYNRKVDLNG